MLDILKHISTYLLVHALFSVWPHCLRALIGPISGPVGPFMGPRRAPEGIIPNNTIVINDQVDDYYQTFSKIKSTAAATATFIRPSRTRKLLFKTLVKSYPKQWENTESYPFFGVVWCRGMIR